MSFIQCGDCLTVQEVRLLYWRLPALLGVGGPTERRPRDVPAPGRALVRREVFLVPSAEVGDTGLLPPPGEEGGAGPGNQESPCSPPRNELAGGQPVWTEGACFP